MATGRRSDVVSIASLSKAIDKAVELAAKRHGVVFGGENVIHNGQIIGRQLREMKEPSRQTRLDVAITVLRNLPTVKGLPVVTKVGKDILIGYIARIGSTIRF